ncbi:anaerobic ribonucleoside-triphosphate reductase activating protein [Candidatus Woesearchaeota archaeon]|nr:anaerobic ribonucleoside-triphosphate reductase activating protein [Candidatus Woesearchaeota archaeon]
MAIDIKGVQRIDLMNYSPNTSLTIFLSRCNFHCPFCHNPELVIGHDRLKSIPEEEVLDMLRSRKEWYDAVCITGGEPTLHSDLPAFIKKIKDIGLLVKLDTNGTNPAMLSELIGSGLVDFISVDVKATMEKYDKVTQVNTDTESIKKTISLLKNSKADYEFRTTAIPFFHSEEDFLKIGEMLSGSKKFSLQQFRNDRPMLNNSFMSQPRFTEKQLMDIKALMVPYFDEVEIKNI